MTDFSFRRRFTLAIILITWIAQEENYYVSNIFRRIRTTFELYVYDGSMKCLILKHIISGAIFILFYFFAEETKSTNPDCPRMNGFYEFPPEDSCQKFYHCLEGKAYEKTCPEGVIFDPSKGTCIHPDLSHRPKCAARAVLNFTCPNAGKKFVRLRFGDHDRLPHTTNCRLVVNARKV